jgi:hypothetical protein
MCEIHISSEQFIIQCIKLLFKHMGKLFKESLGINISQYGGSSG